MGDCQLFRLCNGQTGLINQWIDALDIKRIAWYRSPEYWPVILVLANLWTVSEHHLSVLGISPELFEAAKIDGAGKLQQIRYITSDALPDDHYSGAAGD